MSLKKSFLLFMFAFLANTLLAQNTISKEIASIHTAIEGFLRQNRQDGGFSQDGIYLVILRLNNEKKADSLLIGQIAGNGEGAKVLGRLNYNAYKYSERGVRYLAIPLVILNPANDDEEDNTVGEIYQQSLRFAKTHRSGITRYSKPLLYIRHLPVSKK